MYFLKKTTPRLYTCIVQGFSAPPPQNSSSAVPSPILRDPNPSPHRRISDQSNLDGTLVGPLSRNTISTFISIILLLFLFIFFLFQFLNPFTSLLFLSLLLSRLYSPFLPPSLSHPFPLPSLSPILSPSPSQNRPIQDSSSDGDLVDSSPTGKGQWAWPDPDKPINKGSIVLTRGRTRREVSHAPHMVTMVTRAWLYYRLVSSVLA